MIRWILRYILPKNTEANSLVEWEKHSAQAWTGYLAVAEIEQEIERIEMYQEVRRLEQSHRERVADYSWLAIRNPNASRRRLTLEEWAQIEATCNKILCGELSSVLSEWHSTIASATCRQQIIDAFINAVKKTLSRRRRHTFTAKSFINCLLRQMTAFGPTAVSGRQIRLNNDLSMTRAQLSMNEVRQTDMVSW
ncbi:hypothetical protein AB6A40_008685 [Gnathostoma spinigerum]|uniref:Uncharacterized protein n=1 Tax=Gnathostoma spinigerum TaxID=75299 RepID=A0ABD6ERN1_9BILA